MRRISLLYQKTGNPVTIGDRNISVDEYFKLEAKSESMYNSIRNSIDDVSLIAKIPVCENGIICVTNQRS